jgi:hypothetical protein
MLCWQKWSLPERLRPRNAHEWCSVLTRDGKTICSLHSRTTGSSSILTVEDFEMAELRDAAWTDYERDGNREALAISHALFFRSIFMPSLGSALARVRSGDAEALHIFGDHLEAGLKRRLATQPTAMHSLVQTIVLAKRA